jgi:hypothetical protein
LYTFLSDSRLSSLPSKWILERKSFLLMREETVHPVRMLSLQRSLLIIWFISLHVLDFVVDAEKDELKQKDKCCNEESDALSLEGHRKQ